MKLFCIVFTLFMCLHLSAQPKWIDDDWRKANYPAKIYLVGFASEKIPKNTKSADHWDRLQMFARSQLSEAIFVQINSITDVSVSESNGELLDYVRKNCSSKSNIEIAGLKTENYYHKKSRTAYTIAYARKEDIAALYRNRIGQKITDIRANISVADNYLANGDKSSALKTYNKNYILFREAEEAQTIYMALVNNYNDPNSGIEEIGLLKQQNDYGILSIRRSKNASDEEACFLLAETLKLQADELSGEIRLANFTYQDTRMGSCFTRRFYELFRKQLVGEAGFTINTGAVAGGNNPDWYITGTYWEEGESLRIIAVIRNNSGKTISSAEAFVSIKYLDSLNIAWKPENFTEAFSNMQVFTKNEIVSDNLHTELWTNKGDENLIYTEGEHMQLFVRVNKECYLRVVYYLADGSQVLLLDNYYIDEALVNKVYQLPYEFECSAPFGIEVLQMNAQTEKFPQLKTSKSEGYIYIEEPIADVIEKNRGMKRVDNNLMKSEKRIVITTMK